MSATVLREFAFKLGMQIDDAGLRRANAGVAAIKTGWREAIVAARQLAVVVTAASAAAAVGVGRLVAAVAAQGDAAAKARARTGAAVETLQELWFAAKISGAEVGAVDGALTRLSRTAEMASRGLGQGRTAFAALGIEVTGADGRLRATDEILGDIADGLARTTSATERLAYAQQLLGGSGEELLPLLALGRDGIRELREEAARTGYVLSAEAAAGSERFNDSIFRLQTRLTGLRNQIGVALMPILSDMITGVNRWFDANQELIRQRVDEWADRARRGLLRLRTAAIEVDRVVRDRLGGWPVVISAVSTALAGLVAVFTGARLAGPLVALGSAAAGVAAALLGVSSAAGGLVAGGVLAGLAVTVAALAGWLGFLFLQFEDLYTYLNGGESAFGSFLDRLREGGPTAQAWADYLEEAARLLGDLATLAGEVASGALGEVELLLARGAEVAASFAAGLREVLDVVLALAGIEVPDVLRAGSVVLRAARVGVQAGTRGQADYAAMARRERDASLARAAATATQAIDRSATVTVQVDARGRERPGEIGADVGWAVSRIARRLATGAP